MLFPLQCRVSNCLTFAASTPLLSHQVNTDTSEAYFMVDVTCDGNETKLSDCREGAVVSIRKLLCTKDANDAGVKCIRKFPSSFFVLKACT